MKKGGERDGDREKRSGKRVGKEGGAWERQKKRRRKRGGMERGRVGEKQNFPPDPFGNTDITFSWSHYKH